MVTTDAPCRVAIVDDAPDLRDLLTVALEQEGFVVAGVAGSAADAVELARQGQPSVMVLDLVLPDTDGFEVLRVVADVAPATAVIVLSGTVTDDIRARVDALGASACFRKGAVLPELLEAIRTACRFRARSPDF